MDHYTRIRRVSIRMAARFGRDAMQRAMRSNEMRQRDLMAKLPASNIWTARVAAQIEAIRRLHESRLAFRAAFDGAA